MAYNFSPEVQNAAKYMKRKLIFSRIMGVFFCLLAAVAVALLALQLTPHSTTILLICFSLAGMFMSNGNLQSVKNGTKLYVVNILLASLCFAGMIAFMVISIMNGTLSF